MFLKQAQQPRGRLYRWGAVVSPTPRTVYNCWKSVSSSKITRGTHALEMQPSSLLVLFRHVVLVFNIILVVNVLWWLKVSLVLFIVFRYKVNLLIDRVGCVDPLPVIVIWVFQVLWCESLGREEVSTLVLRVR